MKILWLIHVCLTLTSMLAGSASVTPFSTFSGSHILERVVLIGASATAGMMGPSDTNSAAPPNGLEPYLKAALSSGSTVSNFSNPFFFFAPPTVGRGQVERAVAVDPTLVVAVDYLFWFCYGDLATEEARLARVERGLRELDRIKCKLVIGDIPDASRAAHRMLHPNQIPQAETLAKANRAIREWAVQRGALVVGLAGFMDAAVKNRPIVINSREFPNTRRLLQDDKLHPTPRGAAVMVLAIIGELARAGLADESILENAPEQLIERAIRAREATTPGR